MAKNGDRKIPLLESVFKAFPDIPINVDIKSNSDELINKVSVHVRIMILIFCFTVVCRVYIIILHCKFSIQLYMYLNKKGDRLGLFTCQCRYSCHLMG